jgi:hypothetical protein
VKSFSDGAAFCPETTNGKHPVTIPITSNALFM